MNLLESVQYQAALIVTGCWKGSNRTKVYSDLGWESLSDRRHFRRLSMFYKIKNGLAPDYLVERVRDTPPTLLIVTQNHFSPTVNLTGMGWMCPSRKHLAYLSLRVHF